MATSKKFFVPSRIKLYDAGGDLSKRWFVYYYDQDLKRKKRYGKINQFQKEEDRRIEAQLIIAELTRDKTEADLYDHLLVKLLIEWVEFRKPTLRRHRTYQHYMGKMRCFAEWYQGGKFGVDEAEDFLQWLAEVKAHGNTTRNDYRVIMKSAFTWLVKRNKWPINPFSTIKKIKSEKVPALYFQKAQIAELKQMMLEKEPQLWVFVQMMYYAFIRPSELREMKVGDIFFDEGKILVRRDISKNGKQQYVAIPDPLIPVLIEAFQGAALGNYLFSQSNLPGPTMLGVNTMRSRHTKILKALRYSRDHKLYSWKHTGAVMAVQAGINIKQLQIQLRHHSLEQVDQYLRKLGLSDLSDLTSKFPKI